jgi:hypothetical protein
VDNTVATFGLIVLDIPDYANTTTAKQCNFIAAGNNSATTTSVTGLYGLGYYNQTAGISSLQFFHPDVTNMTSGTILVYGVS